nr:RecName: Full=ATP synthase subunit epsilon, mitochondrial; Short=ATPase subunit epsilon [Yarrowia lipolytica CLIB122]
MSAWMSAGFS